MKSGPGALPTGARSHTILYGQLSLASVVERCMARISTTREPSRHVLDDAQSIHAAITSRHYGKVARLMLTDACPHRWIGIVAHKDFNKGLTVLGPLP